MSGELSEPHFGQAVEIVLDQDVLYIDLNSRYKPCRLRLDALAKDIFIYTGMLGGQPFKGSIAIERTGKSVSGFFFSSTRTRNLYFARSQ